MGEPGRIRFFTIATILFAAVLIGKLFSTSIVKHSFHVALAEKQQNVERDILPRRGAVYLQDRSAGSVTLAATSIERYAISATPKNIKNKDRYADYFANLLQIDRAKLLASFERESLYMDPFGHGLTKDQVEAIQAQLNTFNREVNPGARERNLNFDAAQGGIMYSLNGFFFVREYQRVYPEGGLAGQLLGFVDDRGKGQYGFEGQYDQELRGFTGKVRLEKDSIGNLLGESGSIKGEDGNTYELTIDRNIQYFIEQQLAEEVKRSEAKGGTVIVMNPKTGEIQGMASYPAYDPNNFRTIAKDQIGLFDNPAISKQWEPGSIFKPLVMAAAMNEGVVEASTRETFGATVVVDGYTINTALRRAYGNQSMTDVLVNSDNVAMVWLADKMGDEMVANYLSSMGIGKRTGVDLRNEIAGTFKPVATWSDIDRATTSFGQGVATTPLQVLTAYTPIAGNGNLITPHVVKAVVRPDGKREETATKPGISVIKPEVSDELKIMLTTVVQNGHRRAAVNGYKIGGKTGTAQVPNPNGPGYLDAYVHSFVGFGPVDDPEFLILTKIDEPNISKVGQFAETTAVPVFQRVANFLLNYYQIAPTNR
jgi:cell division protein FtsI/penicillin-binding protein 2